MHTRTFLLLVMLIVSINSCTTSKSPLFAKRSPHEKYGEGLRNAGLANTQLGNAWFAAAAKSITQPQVVAVPYKESGFFAAEKPAAFGYLFSAKRGEKIMVNINSIPLSGSLLFAELWQPAITSGTPALLTTMDTLSRQLQFVVKKDGPYLLRLQPELLHNIEYTITILTGPSLAFPVDRSGDPKIISEWGVARDGGARTHEGIDIGAKFRTPALAAANGMVTRVNENEIGGKVVFLNDPSSGNSIYYAHLDSQIARPGQAVRAGDVIGLVGNTGNARGTVPHLHFGIYTGSGAIAPQSFVEIKRMEPKPVTANMLHINKWLRTTAVASIFESTSSRSALITKTVSGDAVFILAAADNWFKIQLPGGQQGYISSNQVTGKILRSQAVAADTKLLANPSPGAPSSNLIRKGVITEIVGTYHNYYLVTHQNSLGWISK